MAELFGELVEVVGERREARLILGGTQGALLGVVRLSPDKATPFLEGVEGVLSSVPDVTLPYWKFKGIPRRLPPSLVTLCDEAWSGPPGGLGATEDQFFRAVLGEAAGDRFQALLAAPLLRGPLGRTGVSVLLRRTQNLLSCAAWTPFLEPQTGEQRFGHVVVLASAEPFVCLRLTFLGAPYPSLRLASLAGGQDSMEAGNSVQFWAETSALTRSLREPLRPFFGGRIPPIPPGATTDPLVLWRLGEEPPEVDLRGCFSSGVERMLASLRPLLGEMPLEWRVFVARLQIRLVQGADAVPAVQELLGRPGEDDLFPLWRALLEKTSLLSSEEQSLFDTYAERLVEASLESAACGEVVAACLLTRVDEKDSWPPACQSLLQSWPPRLVELGPKATLLLARLKDPSAAGRLGELAGQYPRLIPHLREFPGALSPALAERLLERVSPQFWPWISAALGAAGDPAGVPVVRKILENSSSEMARLAGFYALGCLGCPPGEGEIERSLSSGEPLEKIGAALWAGLCPDPRHEESLLPFLSRGHSLATVAFGALCRQPFSERLRDLLTEELLRLRRAQTACECQWCWWLSFASRSEQSSVASWVSALLTREGVLPWTPDLALTAARCTSAAFPLVSVGMLRGWSEGQELPPGTDEVYRRAMRSEALGALVRLGESASMEGGPAPGTSGCPLVGVLVYEDNEPLSGVPFLLYSPWRSSLLFSGIDGSFRFHDPPHCSEFSLELLE